MPALQNVAQTILQAHLLSRPDKTALILGERTVSYRQLWERAHGFANWLREKPMAPGDRAAVILPDGFAFFYVFFGCVLAGVVPVLINPDASPDDHAFILNDADVALLITTPEIAARHTGATPPHVLPVRDDTLEHMLTAYTGEAIAHAPAPTDMAFMLYTSGSTGDPKGVPHGHEDILFSVETFGQQVLQLTEDDIVFSVSKLFFAYGFGNSLSFPLSAGAAVVLSPERLTPEDILKIMARHRPTVFFGVPTFYNLLLKTMPDAEAFQSVRLCLSAGEALPASLYAEWQTVTGRAIVDGIGSTESLHIYIANAAETPVPGSSGKLLRPFEARIVDDTDQPLPPGEAGELLIRGQSVTPAYWKRADKTAETMLPEGWLRTGDIYVERDGFYFHQGRANDLFKVDAQWVSPTLVESALRTHPAIRECAVAGRRVAGMLRPWAFIVSASGTAADGSLLAELRSHVQAQLPRHMVPVRFVFVEALPKTSTGKIQRFRL